MGDRLRNWAVNALLGIMSILLVVACLELFLYVDDWHPDPAAFTSEVTLNGTTYQFVESIDAVNRSDTAILIAGDSFTAGRSCADQRNFPSAFTRAAQQQSAPVHAVNLGVVGTGPIAYALRVKDYLTEKGRAAGVILAFYTNDIEIDCEACLALQQWSASGGLTEGDREALQSLCDACRRAPEQRVTGNAGLVRRANWWLADHLKTYNLLREAAAKLALGAGLLDADWGRGSFPGRWDDVDGIYFKHVLAAVDLVRQETERRSIPLMVVFYPDPMGLTPDNDYVRIYDKAHRVVSEVTGVAAYSGYDAFLGDARTREDMRFSLTDTHPSCEAHEIFGEWLFRTWAAEHGAQGRP